jgi:ATP-dependent DNA helicase RecG
VPTVQELRERLRRPLERELAMGCQNRVVTAGLESLLENVGGPFPKVREALRGYAGWEVPQRRERLEAALRLLDDRSISAQPAQRPTTATAPKDLPRLGPTLFTPDTDLARLPLGPGGPRKLATLGVRTLRDLLHYYPRRYEDRRALPGFHALEDGAKATITGTITAKSRHQPRKGMLILKATLRDDLGNTVNASWFNQPWVEKNVSEGRRIIVTGRVKKFGRKADLNVEYFEIEDPDGESLATDRIIGVYPSTEGISQDFLRKSARLALEALPEAEDFLSSRERGALRVAPYAEALREAHFPTSEEGLERALARLRFDEYLFLELRVMLQGEHGALGKRFTASDEDTSTFEAALPFRFTNAQRRALADIQADMRSSKQMARLLQGDVGSGKTAVAACALYLAVREGMQGALMSPTEILARQHFANLTSYLFPLGVRVELLIGAMTARERADARARIAAGQVDVVVGTQALIQEGVEFANLGLAVVDEEHRFGVMQRRALLKGRPDVLVMSATPIPRSLALTAYGDLELTIIDELPPGRTPIKTKLLVDTQRTQAYSFVLKQVLTGRQAYEVAPLIEESEAEALQETLAATKLADDLRELLPQARVDLLHGRMSGAEKDDVMARFRNREFDVLVSTTVIEVGVDVPNATVMVIENAERFGLSQLHQLRGRVGRGAEQSYCILVAGEHTASTRKRLKVIEESTDGFVIADADLKLRGPGELRGTRQSGLDDLKLGDITQDAEVIARARDFAKAVLAEDPRLESPARATLRAELVARSEQVAVRDVI